MASTRSATGNSRPRKDTTYAAAVPTTTTKKPRKTARATGGVKKTTTKKAPVKRKVGVKAKVEGVVEKAKGVVEGKPGKKVRAAGLHKTSP
jgi:hypothetical protein